MKAVKPPKILYDRNTYYKLYRRRGKRPDWTIEDSKKAYLQRYGTPAKDVVFMSLILKHWDKGVKLPRPGVYLVLKSLKHETRKHEAYREYFISDL